MRFYLLGYPVEHSMSPPMHNAAFNELALPHEYGLLNTPPERLGETIKSLRVEEFGGASVTIPHKIDVMKHLDEITPIAARIGAVNTIEHREERLIGHNTDATGGLKALTSVYGDISGSTVVLLGAGGAARALANVLAPEVDELIILNRSKDRADRLTASLEGKVGSGDLRDQNVIGSADIVINTTPVGMSPKIHDSPVDPKHLHKDQLVYDIVYNPLKTRLLRDAEKRGAETLGGLWMLVYQGVEAFKIWTGIEPNPETMYNAARKVLEESG